MWINDLDMFTNAYIPWLKTISSEKDKKKKTDKK
jgi:hypothetical protein